MRLINLVVGNTNILFLGAIVLLALVICNVEKFTLNS